MDLMPTNVLHARLSLLLLIISDMGLQLAARTAQMGNTVSYPHFNVCYVPVVA